MQPPLMTLLQHPKTLPFSQPIPSKTPSRMTTSLFQASSTQAIYQNASSYQRIVIISTFLKTLCLTPQQATTEHGFTLVLPVFQREIS